MEQYGRTSLCPPLALRGEEEPLFSFPLFFHPRSQAVFYLREEEEEEEERHTVNGNWPKKGWEKRRGNVCGGSAMGGHRLPVKNGRDIFCILLIFWKLSFQRVMQDVITHVTNTI